MSYWQFDSGEPYASTATIGEKVFTPDQHNLRGFGLTRHNCWGETNPDTYLVGLINIPEMPNREIFANSPSLYAAVEPGDAVDLTLVDHTSRRVKADGQVLEERMHVSINSISADDVYLEHCGIRRLE